MDGFTYIVLGLLEAVMVLAVLSGYLFLKNRQLRLVQEVVPETGHGPQDRLDEPSDWIGEQLERTEARLAELRMVDKQDQDEGYFSDLRRQFLVIERQAAILGAGDENRFWRTLAEELAAVLPRPDKPVQDESLEKMPDIEDVPDPVSEGREVTHLKNRLSIYEERVANLERFKELFFDIKPRLEQQEILVERLQSELTEALDQGGEVTMLQATIEQLAYEKSDLQERVAEMSNALAELPIAQNAGGPIESGTPPENLASEPSVEPESPAGSSRIEAVGETGRLMSEDVARMREMVGGQEARIRELNTLVGDLRLEVDDKSRLEQICSDLEGRVSDLRGQAESMEQENQFLLEQISSLLKQELIKDEQFATELQRIEERMAGKETDYRELEARYADLERQYLEAQKPSSPGNS